MRKLILLGAITALLCGVAHADPTSSSHDVTDHPELDGPMFCSVSYVILWERIKLDPGVPSANKKEIQRRGRGIIPAVAELGESLGHTDEELGTFYVLLYEEVMTWTEDEWLAMAQREGCKEMTDAYSGLHVWI